MKLSIKLENVQHITKLCVDFDFDENKILCITGKNSVGKTTLIRTIHNLYASDIFSKTSSPETFNTRSRVTYKIDDLSEIVYTYNPKIKQLDSKEITPSYIKKRFFVEHSLPNGTRFTDYHQLEKIDFKIRSAIATINYNKPDELISFLNTIYETEKFNNIIEITVSKTKYYALLDGQGYYIREDYFSSGEYFLVSLYKIITSETNIIFIDEIDISLDAAAQVRLIKLLRKYCEIYNTSIFFTTHSLPLMKTLNADELFYLENNDGICEYKNVSYNFIKSTLYGFSGWDCSGQVFLATPLEQFSQ